MTFKRPHRLGAEIEIGLAHFFALPRQEASSQAKRVSGPLPQGRNANLHDVKTIIQVLTELAGPGHRFEIPVRGGNHPDIHLAALGRADLPDLTLLQNPE